jgi:hypothetical protein
MKETYKKCDNCGYTKTQIRSFAAKIKRDGRRALINIHFKCSILLIKHMMLKYGHEIGVLSDITFGTNENKVHTYILLLVLN